MTRRQLVSSGAIWESVVGYSRAVRVGSWVSVAGTTAAAEGGGAIGGADVGAQAREALRRIAAALEQAGAGLQDVVRTSSLTSAAGRRSGGPTVSSSAQSGRPRRWSRSADSSTPRYSSRSKPTLSFRKRSFTDTGERPSDIHSV